MVRSASGEARRKPIKGCGRSSKIYGRNCRDRLECLQPIPLETLVSRIPSRFREAKVGSPIPTLVVLVIS